ncbi:MAG: vanadium-dependent haloperoxidase [Sulfitobacter sp.]
MMTELRPIPDTENRREIADRIRKMASQLAKGRGDLIGQSNNGEAAAALDGAAYDEWIAAHGTFTKGLSHDHYGRVKTKDIKGVIDALNQAPADPAQAKESPFPGVYAGPDAGKAAKFDVQMHQGGYIRPSGSPKSRTFESPLSGHTFDLEGADADTVGILPAPELGSDELIAEMAEVYGAALLRDIPFTKWATDPKTDGIAQAIAGLPFFTQTQTGAAGKRAGARGNISASTLFAGSTQGAKTGPYISQFLLVGNAERTSLGAGDAESGVHAELAAPSQDALNRAARFVPSQISNAMAGGAKQVGPQDGFIRYGTQVIPQQITGHLDGLNHMTEWATWRDVQNGSNRKDAYDRFNEKERFIATPRDLATYVHFDALYQAYLNTCLILLGGEQPSDLGLPEGGGHPTRDGFATFGGPEILTRVTEVATRALKAVRRQKYNIHLRARPEAVAAGISLAWEGGDAADSLGKQKGRFESMKTTLEHAGILTLIAEANALQNEFWAHQYEGDADLGPLSKASNALLPMAFPEGSPMHPAYGAGHATVAGACVTILKAFFEMYDLSDGAPDRGELPLYDIVNKKSGYPGEFPSHLFGNERLLTGANAMLPNAYVPDHANHFQTLKAVEGPELTIQGELDKLAANVSIGRNFAGVHYYSDYYESLRMGERIAVSILQQHMLTYREPVSMRFKSFDDDNIMICGTGGSRGQNDAVVFVWDADGNGGSAKDFGAWWNAHR